MIARFGLQDLSEFYGVFDWAQPFFRGKAHALTFPMFPPHSYSVHTTPVVMASLKTATHIDFAPEITSSLHATGVAKPPSQDNQYLRICLLSLRCQPLQTTPLPHICPSRPAPHLPNPNPRVHNHPALEDPNERRNKQHPSFYKLSVSFPVTTVLFHGILALHGRKLMQTGWQAPQQHS